MIHWKKPLIALITFCSLTLSAMAEEVGEFSIPSIMPLTTAQQQQLQLLVANDPRAAELAQEQIDAARQTLDRPPTPLAVIRYEGLVNTDPRRIEDVQSLTQMTDAALLLRAWQATGEAAFAAKLRELILAWSGTYQPTGNDVNENKLYPLLVAYLALQETFPAEQQASVEQWIRNIGQRHFERARNSKSYNNRFTKSLRLTAATGLILGEPTWVEAARAGAQRFITNSLYADGTSYDLKHRDTLTYHGSALRPLIELSILLDGDGPAALYHWDSPEGGSVERSVQYVVPYATGEKQRAEWTNSEVELDRKRAAAGLEAYQAGRLFEPVQAVGLLTDAGFYETQFAPLVAKLLGVANAELPRWENLLHQAVHEAAATGTP